MLTADDYRSLKKSVRGWTAKRLRFHGESWPPVHGWRRRLLSEYEQQQQRLRPEKGALSSFSAIKAAPKIASSNTPDLRIRLRTLLNSDRTLTAAWYARMAEGEHFPAEERRRYALEFAAIQQEIQTIYGSHQETNLRPPLSNLWGRNGPNL